MLTERSAPSSPPVLLAAIVATCLCLGGCTAFVTDATRRHSVESHLEADTSASLAAMFRKRCFFVMPITQSEYDADDDRTRYSGQGFGTAAIITPDGYALTAAHTVGDRRGVIVFLQDGDEAHVTLARVVWKSEVSKDIDFALIRLTGDWGGSADAFTWAPDVDLSEGMAVAMVGRDDAYSALGESMAAGRLRGVEHGVATSPITVDRIWHDAPQRPGDSGGPLVTEDGELIGINVYWTWYPWEGVRRYALRPDRRQIMAMIRADRVRRGVTDE